jgi:hypothetical protein
VSSNYRERANRFAPKTADEIQAAARRLADQGFGDFDIAWILGLDVAAARKLIGDRRSA